jgi:two-component system, chemotaxis family, sensor kinase CheA
MARDPYRYFRIEARDLLDQMAKGVLELDQGTAAPELVALILRLAHTLKGAARVVKQPEIAECAHGIEDALAPFREGLGAVAREAVDACLKALDTIARRVAALSSQPTAQADETVTREAEATPAPAAAARLAEPRPLGAEPPVVAADRQLSPDEPMDAGLGGVDDVDVLLDGLTEAGVQLAVLRGGGKLLQRGRHLAQLLEEQLSAPRAGRAAELSSKLPSLMAELRGLMEKVERNFNDSVEQVDRELAQAREAAERLRLLPARFMFVSLQRTARDAAELVDKRVAFVTRGGEVRLDAQVFGAVQGALVQAVRNAVAHGIESRAEREAAGKPAEGEIQIEVRRRGHRAVFVCRDDGRGVDLDAVRRAMQRRGVLPRNATPGREELLTMLLEGGVSTSDNVTQLAGRGVGLDVVREAVNRLRGEVSMRTDEGRGTTLEIVVPVSLAALDALIVESAGRVVAIPLDAVRRTVRVDAGEVAHSAQGASIIFEGQVVPFVPLARALRRESKSNSGASFWSAVIVEGANALAAVGIDRLRGTQSLILRPLPELTPSDAIVAGASLDGEGHPQLVLDADALVEQVRGIGAPPTEALSKRAPILVIDDSLTTRMLEQSILESAGYEVELATSAEVALEKARHRNYALFLVDVEMPGMDGFTFVEHTRADPVLREVPAILVTSRASPEDRERGRAVGASAHICKGEFDQGELLDKIRELLGGQ